VYIRLLHRNVTPATITQKAKKAAVNASERAGFAEPSVLYVLCAEEQELSKHRGQLFANLPLVQLELHF
jgi:hypothetical protein